MSLIRTAAVLATTLLTQCQPSGSAEASSALEGRWVGDIALGGDRQGLELDISRSADGAWSATAYLPDQMRWDSTATMQVSGDSVQLSLVTGEPLTVAGVRVRDSLVLRPVRANAPTPPLEVQLKRTEPSVHRRVAVESLVVVSGTHRLPAFLVMPTRDGPWPAAILVHGSGQGRKESLLPLARNLAEHGVAALVHDKRPIQVVRGDEITSADSLVDDVMAAREVLRRRREIRQDQVGVIGTSQGSGVAAIAAARDSSASHKIAWVVSVSGGGTSYTEFVQFQVANRLRNRGVSERDIATAREVVRLRYALLDGHGDSAQLAARLRALPTQLRAVDATLTMPTPEERDAWNRTLRRATGAADSTGTGAWRKVHVPVLAMWGADDALVPASAAARNVAAALRAAGNSDATICITPNADHGMMQPGHLPTPTDKTFRFAKLSPLFVDGIAEWILAHAKRTRVTLDSCTAPS